MSELSILKGKLTKLQKKYKQAVDSEKAYQTLYENLKADYDSSLKSFNDDWQSMDSLAVETHKKLRKVKESLEKAEKENEFLKSRNLIQRILNVKYGVSSEG